MGNDKVNGQPKEHLKHSVWGIASFIASISGALTIAFVYTIGGIIALITHSPYIGYADTLGTLLLILGFIMSIVGLFQKKRKRLFSILTLAVSALVLASPFLIELWIQFYYWLNYS